MHQAAQQLKELYPDSYPMGSYVGASWYSVAKVIFMINRTSQALYYNGSEFVLGPIHDEDRYRASLEYLNRLYEEGLLDPEFFTQTGDQSKEKTVNGTYFFVPNHFAGNILRFNTNEVYPGSGVGLGSAPERVGWPRRMDSRIQQAGSATVDVRSRDQQQACRAPIFWSSCSTTSTRRR